MGENGTKGCLLVADNEPDQLSAMAHTLRSAGYQVLEATNGSEVLDQVREKQPDLILLDVMLPDKSGLEVLKEINSDKTIQDIFVILIFEVETPSETQSEGFKEGADGYLTKPILEGELLAHIASLMRIKESESNYKIIFENTGTATIIAEEDRTISLANSEFEELSGYLKEEIEGKKEYTDFVTGEDQEKMIKYHDLRRIDPNSAPRNYEFKFRDRKGNLKDIFITVGMITGTMKSVLSLLDITKKKKAEKDFSRESQINSDLAKLSRKLLQSTPIEDISDVVLEYAQKFTRSKFSFVGYIDPETGYLISPTMTHNIWTECHVKDKSIIFKKFGGMWGWVLNNKKSILTNQPEDDSRSTGTPPGHIAIETFLAVPALVNDKLVGIISLANSNEYDKNDLEVIQRLADLYAIAITRKHADDSLKRSEEKYRTIVEKFLKISNEIIMEISKKEE
ncbi:response regulator [Methanobacterium ferruginis]|uniref:response regulator n=1 Tax=Methanobacterium ferruginis TaxID=710191 RepID=UPI002572F5FD|nr:response regulator [Methanobacterium ferruginis]BDZ69265.1 histidine kinase [Methanobacterium ferruginis]